MQSVAFLERSTRAAHRPGVLPVAVLLFACLAACKSSPPAPTVVHLDFTALANANPDRQKRPSPVEIRVYELGQPTKLTDANFVKLLQNDKDTLGSDFIKAREPFSLFVDASCRLSITATPQTQYIGVVAAYQLGPTGNWRTSAAVVPNKTIYLAVQIGAADITITRVPRAPRKIPNPCP